MTEETKDSLLKRVHDLEAMVARLQQKLVEAGAGELEDRIDASLEVRCPKCRFVMDERDQHGVTVDVCRGCRGIFFDQGEVDSMIKTVEKQDDPGATSGFLARIFGR